MKAFIYRHGTNVEQKSRWFLIGLIVFWIGAVGLWLGYQAWHGWFYLSLVLIIPGFLMAIYGYSAILANRFAQVIENREKYKNSISNRE